MRQRLVWPVLLLVALLVRMVGLGREPIWTDEMHTVVHAGVDYAARTHVWTVAHLREITQGPLFMLLVNGWTRLAGNSEFALRLLPCLFGDLGKLLLGSSWLLQQFVLFVLAT